MRGIDVTRARRAPGVVAVVLASDAPRERGRDGGERDRPGLISVGEEIRCEGDALALIAASTEEQAWRAASMVDLICDPLTPVLSAYEALSPDAPRVHPMRSNLVARAVLTRGNAASTLAMSAFVASGCWTSRQLEAPRRMSAVAALSQGGLEIVTRDDDKALDEVARFLATPDGTVRRVPTDDASARAHDLSVHEHAALLARITRCPVRISLDAAHTSRLCPAPRPVDIEYELGCDADGRLTALRARFVADSGAYASISNATLEHVVSVSCGRYRVSSVDVEAYAVCTNHPPTDASLGLDDAQVSFALERCLDLLASKAHLAPEVLRDRNAPEANAA